MAQNGHFIVQLGILHGVNDNHGFQPQLLLCLCMQLFEINHSISTTVFQPHMEEIHLKDSQHWQSWNISRVFWSINVRTQLSKHQRPSTPWTSPCQKHNVNNLGCNFLFQILAQPPSVQSRLNDTTPICFVELHQTLGTWWYLHAVHASEF